MIREAWLLHSYFVKEGVWACLGWKTFVQLLKFGISGVAGIWVSAVLFYAAQNRLPVLVWTLWAYQFDAANVGFYVFASVVGGTIHFILSKVWVFD